MKNGQRIYSGIKGFLFILVNKEFLIFLFFLAVSCCFWFLSALNDFYEREFPVEVKLTEVPENVIITEGLPDTVRVTVRDKGYSFLQIMLDGGIKPLHLTFRLYADNKGKGMVSSTEIQKILRPRLSETATITSVKAEHWDFFFNHGKKKKVPIILDSSINTKSNYYVTRCSLTPDSAVVFAMDEALDTIRMVHTEHVQFDNVSGALSSEVKLQRIRGAKVYPATTKVSIITDQLTEVSLHVPVKTINVPENAVLKTFPAVTEIKVAVGIKSSGLVKAELFSIVADYNDISTSSQKVPLKVQSQPKGIVKVTLTHPTVDYLIEK